MVDDFLVERLCTNPVDMKLKIFYITVLCIYLLN